MASETGLEIVFLHSTRVDKSPNPNGGQGLRRSSITVYLSKGGRERRAFDGKEEGRTGVGRIVLRTRTKDGSHKVSDASRIDSEIYMNGRNSFV